MPLFTVTACRDGELVERRTAPTRVLADRIFDQMLIAHPGCLITLREGDSVMVSVQRR